MDFIEYNLYREPKLSNKAVIYPPGFKKPPEAKNEQEYRLKLIEQTCLLIKHWIEETVTNEIAEWYAYRTASDRVTTLSLFIDKLLISLNYDKPQIAKQIKDIWSKLDQSADKHYSLIARYQRQTTKSALRPSVQIPYELCNPIECKKFAAVLYNVLCDYYRLIANEGETKGGKPEDPPPKKSTTIDMYKAIKKLSTGRNHITVLKAVKQIYDQNKDDIDCKESTFRKRYYEWRRGQRTN